MLRTNAPFRADEVGSLLRPPRIKQARARLEAGEITPNDLRIVEDSEIEKVVHKQEFLGLKLADRVVILERGAIVHDAASAALKADPAVLERYLGVAGTATH